MFFETLLGENGDVKGTPKDLILHKIERYAKNPTPIPRKPKAAPKNINKNLKVLK